MSKVISFETKAAREMEVFRRVAELNIKSVGEAKKAIASKRSSRLVKAGATLMLASVNNDFSEVDKCIKIISKISKDEIFKDSSELKQAV